MGLSLLKQHNFVILRYISTKLGGKLCIYCLYQLCKILCKNLHALLKSTEDAGDTFYVHVVYDADE